MKNRWSSKLLNLPYEVIMVATSSIQKNLTTFNISKIDVIFVVGLGLTNVE